MNHGPFAPRASRSFALAFAALGCGNRAIDERIAALGDEAPDVPPSEFHRPGQPCLLCHGEYLREGPIMTVAGTIYAFPARDKPLPVKGVTVKFTRRIRRSERNGNQLRGQLPRHSR